MGGFELTWAVRRVCLIWLAVLAGVVCLCVAAESPNPVKPVAADVVVSAAKEGRIAYRLTTPEEMQELLGPALKDKKDRDGDFELVILEYPDVQATFGRISGYSSLFTLRRLVVGQKIVDIGAERLIVLRNEDDLKKIDYFFGLENVSLANLDLRDKLKVIEVMSFDTRTVWPEPNKMPEGFEPARLLEEGKNPGLGIRNLHKKGIDGRGVGIAIIDQPLVRNHKELRDNVVQFEDVDVQNVGPQMHGPGVSSIAVGKTCGVAPAASLVYYATPQWKWNSCRPYCDVIDKILELNKTLKDSEKIRVVSISQGMFSRWSDFADWKKVVEKTAGEGILVVPCGTTLLDYGTLTRITDKNPDEPTSYRRGKESSPKNALLVPAGNRTIAGQVGPEVYKFDRGDAMSWAAPYLAGLAALAFQVNPEIKPDEIVKLWVETAVKTNAGPVVNPTGFIDAVQKNKRRDGNH